MRPLTCLLLVLLLANCARPVILAESFGVVDLTPDLRMPCVIFPTSARSGEPVQVIILPSEKAIGARVTDGVTECGSGQEARYVYKLQLDEKVDRVRGLISVRGTVSPEITFRECSGSGSLHLTAWQSGRRVWHRHIHLGYDVEPDCRPEEIN